MRVAGSRDARWSGCAPFFSILPKHVPSCFPSATLSQTKPKKYSHLLSVLTACFQFGTSTLHSFSCGIVPAIHSLALHSLCRDPDFQYPVYQVCRHFQNLDSCCLACHLPLQLRLSNWSSYVTKPQTPAPAHNPITSQLNQVMLARYDRNQANSVGK